MLPRDLPLPSVRVTARWTDSGGGLCVMNTVVAEADPRDDLTPWLLVATGEITRVPRRTYVREQVSGRVHVAPLSPDEGRGASGDVVDLSEGGIRIQPHLVEGVNVNSAVRIVRRSPITGRTWTCAGAWSASSRRRSTPARSRTATSRACPLSGEMLRPAAGQPQVQAPLRIRSVAPARIARDTAVRADTLTPWSR